MQIRDRQTDEYMYVCMDGQICLNLFFYLEHETLSDKAENRAEERTWVTVTPDDNKNMSVFSNEDYERG